MYTTPALYLVALGMSFLSEWALFSRIIACVPKYDLDILWFGEKKIQYIGVSIQLFQKEKKNLSVMNEGLTGDGLQHVHVARL